MSNMSAPYLSSMLSQTFLQTIISSYVGLEEGISGRKMWREFKSFTQYLPVHLASASSPASVGVGPRELQVPLRRCYLLDFRVPHDQTSRSVAYSLIRCSLPASIHAKAMRPGRKIFALRSLWHLQLAFRRRGARHARAGHDRSKVQPWLRVGRSSHC